jgi:hypothetical protein
MCSRVLPLVVVSAEKAADLMRGRTPLPADVVPFDCHAAAPVPVSTTALATG